MNEVEFRSEQFKAICAVQTKTIDPNAVITGMRLENGNYHVLSRCGDNVWTLPDSLFSAGTKDNHKKLNFLSVPLPFRETLMACMTQYILRGIEGRPTPKGGTIHQFFVKAAPFLTWLQEKQIVRLSDVTPLICQQYVEFCKDLKGRKGEQLSGKALLSRFGAVETLHILSQQTDDHMRHPWRESSSRHLAGLSGQNNSYLHEAKTEIIPDDILGPLFQSAVEWLDRADEIISLRAQIESWKSDGHSYSYITPSLKKLGWKFSEIREAEQHLQAACISIILITSGIRLSELCSLENRCAFKRIDEQGEPFHWMKGVSYKTNAGDCEWLVAEITHRALAVAERLALPLQRQLQQRIFDLRSNNPKCQRPDDRLNHKSYPLLAARDLIAYFIQEQRDGH